MTSLWTSRGRVEVALRHEEPDCVPTDLAITLDAYINLRKYLGLPPEKNIPADSFFEVRASLDVLNALGIDITFVRLRKPMGWNPKHRLPEGIVLDEWGVGRQLVQLPNGSWLNEIAYSPLASLAPTEIDLDAYPWPDPLVPGRTIGLEEEARQLYDETDLAIMGRFGGPVLEIASYLRGYQQWLMDLVLYPEFACELLNKIADIQISLDEQGIRAAGKYLTILKVSGEDLGMQDRPLFSVKTWREVLYPVLKRRWLAARDALDRYAPHVPIMLHSDGAVRPFIPDFIEAGIQVLDPIQGRCEGMELSGLKQDFGDRLTFHGAVDTQQLLPFGNELDIETEVIRCIETLGVGGGLILSPSHFVQSDVPPENIWSMYKAAKRFGKYT